MTRDALAEALSAADVLVPTIGDRIDAGLLKDAGSDLRLVANFGAGVDHIDLGAAEARGLLVTNTPGVLARDTAEVTLALILVLSHRLLEGATALRAGTWAGWSPTAFLGSRVAGRRLGILGLGRVGTAVARRSRALRLGVHYHSRRRVSTDLELELDATYHDTLGGLLNNSDILSIHCPLTEETRGLISAQALGTLPRGAIVINTARGGIVDEEALASLLADGHLGGAGLDVYATPPKVPQALLDAPNTVLLPHLASATHEARLAMGERVMVNIQTFLHGHAPPDRVFRSMFVLPDESLG